MRTLYFIGILLLMIACQSDDDTTSYITGRSDVYLNVDNTERHFALHIPESYDPSKATPVVFMLHGSSGDGDKFYRISGWTEVSDSTGIISVFPSSGRYCIEEDGVTKNTTKWNTYRSDWDFCDPQDALNDQRFFREIIDYLDDQLNVDQDRVYLVGFSNGGIMASQSAVELGDLFAAVSSNAGTFLPGETYQPQRDIPFMTQVGNEEGFLRAFNAGNPYPLNQIEDLLDLPGVQHVFDIPIEIFNLSTQYSRSGNVNQQVCLTFPAMDSQSNHEYRFCLVNKLAHNYPNGRNHPMEAAWEQWNWMNQFSR